MAKMWYCKTMVASTTRVTLRDRDWQIAETLRPEAGASGHVVLHSVVYVNLGSSRTPSNRSTAVVSVAGPNCTMLRITAEQLIRSYWALVPVKDQLWPLEAAAPDKFFVAQLQEALISALISDFDESDLSPRPVWAEYQPSRAYQRKFWKWVIQHLEDADEASAGCSTTNFPVASPDSNSAVGG